MVYMREIREEIKHHLALLRIGIMTSCIILRERRVFSSTKYSLDTPNN